MCSFLPAYVNPLPCGELPPTASPHALTLTAFNPPQPTQQAVRHVQYHRAYPLMASASDDGTVHVFHCTVYECVSFTRSALSPARVN